MALFQLLDANAMCENSPSQIEMAALQKRPLQKLFFNLTPEVERANSEGEFDVNIQLLARKFNHIRNYSDFRKISTTWPGESRQGRRLNLLVQGG